MVHFLEFFFSPAGKPWWEGAVWGNVVAVIPLAIVGLVGFIWHKGVLKEAHEKLDRLESAHRRLAPDIARVLALVDPEVDGGVTAQVAHIEDLLDINTPGGLHDLLDHLTKGNDAAPPSDT